MAKPKSRGQKPEQSDIEHLNRCLGLDFDYPVHDQSLRHAGYRLLREQQGFNELCEEKGVEPEEFLESIQEDFYNLLKGESNGQAVH